ncbi:class I SAM-dependent methyltransferase [Azospirillum halopraeferens]|uniref:class I SAM-dependent methyltransferase n=1 Tax=Azospirillum halopraeferens TaxID=34010 RepID=UPI000405AE7C|nr:class I SAM-dependent methyltransferase [Azospirillum halopraeferens]
MSDYYAHGSFSLAFYDLLTALSAVHLAGDVDFYAALAGPPPRTVLEIGAGTGRVANTLAARGYDVVGLDRAAGMLAAATRSGGGARFVCADMTRFALTRRFDLVIAPFYTFSHLDSDRARRLALGCLREHLAEGGRIALHLVRAEVLDTDIPAEQLAAQQIIVRLDGAGLTLRVRIVDRIVDRLRQVCDQRVEYAVSDAAGAVIGHSVETLRYGWMSEGERDRLLGTAGLRLLERRSAFGPEPGGEDILVLGV